MKKYANMKIKDLIQKYPNVTKVLGEFKLPCRTCGDNNCLTKDIVEIENLSLKDEMKFIKKMSEAIEESENLLSNKE
jgi:hypothetical protein